MMQVFISAAWSRRDEAKALAADLEEDGVYVKARWLYERGARPGHEERHTIDMIYQDLSDIGDCNVFVRLADDLSEPTVPSHLATGARMFEQGIAWGMAKEIIVVGGKQMIYDNMRNVQHVKNTLELRSKLCPNESPQ
jgi:hypothetical protein